MVLDNPSGGALRAGNPGAPAIPMFERLDQIVTILGSTKRAFYPFITGGGTKVFPYGAGNGGGVAVPSDESATITLESEFDPFVLTGSLCALYFDSISNNHLNADADSVYSHDSDTPFSLGAWLWPTVALGSQTSALSKFEPAIEEYDFRYDESGNLALELHDASASATEIGTGASDPVVPDVWNFVVATYDGGETSPVVHLYRNAVDSLASGATVESGAYEGMEAGAATFKVGCRGATTLPRREFEGYMALPFITGKELIQADVDDLFAIGQELIGLA